MNDYWDLGVAVGPLDAPAGLYYPVKIAITGWSDNSKVSGASAWGGGDCEWVGGGGV